MLHVNTYVSCICYKGVHINRRFDLLIDWLIILHYLIVPWLLWLYLAITLHTIAWFRWHYLHWAFQGIVIWTMISYEVHWLMPCVYDDGSIEVIRLITFNELHFSFHLLQGVTFLVETGRRSFHQKLRLTPDCFRQDHHCYHLTFWIQR